MMCSLFFLILYSSPCSLLLESISPMSFSSNQYCPDETQFTRSHGFSKLAVSDVVDACLKCGDLKQGFAHVRFTWHYLRYVPKCRWTQR